MTFRSFVVVLIALGTPVALCFATPQDSAPASSDDDGGRPIPKSIVDDSLYLLPDFEANVIYRHPPGHGSWISLTVDDKGRLITSTQLGGLYRITLATDGAAVDVQRLKIEIGGIQGLVYAFDSLYAVVNHYRDESSGLYRLRDTNGDDHYDEVKRLRVFESDNEHGPHDVILSPDGQALYIVAGNRAALPEPEKSKGARNWSDDGLLSYGRPYGDGISENRAGGWVCRTDPDGETFELIASGFRNPYDIAFNADGEMFTYDADMEDDMGLPWYRPTRVNHITSGAEFGWRAANRKWPDYYLDSLGAVYDIGMGSPTGLTFGYGAKFPAKYQRALLMCDWSYGKIYAAHLVPQGASYVAEAEPFLSGTPLPVTDIVVHPDDGAVYFVTGGRGTTSALYRVIYTGSESTEQVAYTDERFSEERQERRRLEQYHGSPNADAVDAVWSSLGSQDRNIRFAARVALENQPLDTWLNRALNETDARTAIAALAAVVRSGSSEIQTSMMDALVRIDWDGLDDDERVDLLRVFFLTFSRTSPLHNDVRTAATEYLNPLFPASEWRVNRELCQLLAHLDAPGLVKRTLDVVREEHSQEEQVYYLQCLSTLGEERFSLAQHREYFAWYSKIIVMGGGYEADRYIGTMKSAALEHLSEERLATLDGVINAPLPPDPYTMLQAREFVNEWTVDELLPVLNTDKAAPDFKRGQQVYGEALCIKCHRFNGRGGSTGPDLTGVGARYDNRSIVESLLTPDKVIPDQYNTAAIYMKDGSVFSGRIKDVDTRALRLLTDLFNPAQNEALRYSEIDEIKTSPTSAMPAGLLDGFTQEEILDMIAFLKSQGNPNHKIFSP